MHGSRPAGSWTAPALRDFSHIVYTAVYKITSTHKSANCYTNLTDKSLYELGKWSVWNINHISVPFRSQQEQWEGTRNLVAGAWNPEMITLNVWMQEKNLTLLNKNDAAASGEVRDFSHSLHSRLLKSPQHINRQIIIQFFKLKVTTVYSSSENDYEIYQSYLHLEITARAMRETQIYSRALSELKILNVRMPEKKKLQLLNNYTG